MRWAESNMSTGMFAGWHLKSKLEVSPNRNDGTVEQYVLEQCYANLRRKMTWLRPKACIG